MGEENNDTPSKLSRFAPTIILAGSIAGFIALAYYAYNTGRQSVKEEDLLVVEADKTPFKEKPLDPGGMKIPNQDKTVFETFSGNAPAAKVERVLPSPEEPMAKDKIIFEDTPQPEETVVSEEENKNETGKSNPKPAEKPEPKPEKEIKQSHESETKKEEKPAAKPTTKSDGAKVQLGAYKSEAEAKEMWAKIQKKNSALSSYSPLIVRADVPGKGVFYRLRVGGLKDKNAAKSLCNKLSSDGQACILVGE